MKILSCGAGMQSTALALMSCENKREGVTIHPLVPIYDAIIFCDLGKEPSWVYDQVEFIQVSCLFAGIPFYILKTNLYHDMMNDFGKASVPPMPFWTLDTDGKKGIGKRGCTLDYKILAIQKFMRWNLLGYKKGQRTRPEDIKAHEMHIGFSKEEKQRIFESNYPLYITRFPLVEMGFERKDSYAYIRDVWGYETKASACSFCPFHRNYFYKYLKDNLTEEYNDVVAFDDMLEREQYNTRYRSQLFISRSRKRIRDLRPEECCDKECFPYKGQQIWKGF